MASPLASVCLRIFFDRIAAETRVSNAPRREVINIGAPRANSQGEINWNSVLLSTFPLPLGLSFGPLVQCKNMITNASMKFDYFRLVPE
jgi:hypothetical protein